MSIKRIISVILLFGSFGLDAKASNLKEKLNTFDNDQDTLNPWGDDEKAYSSELLCIDKIDSVQKAVQLLNQKEICKVTPSVTAIFSDAGISSISEIVNKTVQSPSSQSEFKIVEASRYLVDSSFAGAFLPTLGLSSGSVSKSDLVEKTSSKTKRYIPVPVSVNSLADPAWSFTETNTSSDPTYYAQFALTVPIYKPALIQTYIYKKSSGKAQAFSSTSAIDREVETSIEDAISLWVSYKQIKMNKLNVIAALESLETTIGQYKIGEKAIPDVAEALSQLRSNQSELASEYETYFSSFNSLALQLGLKPSDLYFNPEFLNVSFLNPLLDYSQTLNSETLQNSVAKSNSVYNYLYLSSSYLDLGKSYLANYLPAVSLSLGYTYNTFNDTIKTSNCSGDWNCELKSKENEIFSSNEPSISLNFSWQFFDSGQAYYEYRSSKMTAESNFDNAVNSAYEAVESITTDFQTQLMLEDQIDFNYSSLSSSMVSYRDTLLAYKAGFSDTTSLVQRLTQLVSARSTFLSSIKSQLETKLSIMQSLRDGIYSDLNYFDLNYNQDLTEKLNVIND